MGADALAHDRQPEPRAALVPRTAFVQPHERLENPFAVGLGDARPVVRDAQHRRTALDRHGHGDLRRVPFGVVEQVAQHPFQVCPVANHLDRPGHAGQLGEVDALGGVVADAGEEQQVGDDRLHPVEVEHGVLGGSPPVDPIGVGEQHFERGAGRG